MAPEFQAVVHNAQFWLQSSWHIQAPFAWLEACVEWLQEEAGGAGRLSQQQINQQALDQWLLADLRDLDHPVLPQGLAQAQKTELIGTFCVQVDSLLDISQPAYSQLQKLRGTDCANDEVSAVTQATQRPWETRPTRMLLLQVTDGVQSLEAMEYQSIPALSAALRPGVKLQLHGNMVCRLGVLLLGPSNVKVLGGEVEDLVERNNQGRVMCRTLGLPDEGGEAPSAPQQDNQDMEDLELDDAELLASLEAQEVVQSLHSQPESESGYGTLSDACAQTSSMASVRSLVSLASARNGTSAQGGLTQSHRAGSAQGHHRAFEENSDFLPSDRLHQQEIQSVEDEDFPDEDFDAIPMDELDAVLFHENTADLSRRLTDNPDRAPTVRTVAFGQKSVTSSASRLSASNSKSTKQIRKDGGWLAAATPSALTNADCNFMKEDMDCILIDVETGGTAALPVQQGPSTNRDSYTKKTIISDSGGVLGNDSARSVTTRKQSSTPALTLTSSPFTYLCLLEQMVSRPDFQTTEIRLKAFIVTLLGKLSSSNNAWNICATISDGTGYLDAELSDEVLRGLLGFSVEEKGVVKRDPSQRGRLEMGMRRCQEELVDMCCIMTLVVEAEDRKAVVTKVEAISENVLQELEQRRRAERK
ncbi:recQ-mediated genome instability protein 1 [Takifugu rubripes]|uniref:recQ-mediated genome instability protein 1 n=1 Tax=Takifugu rubripes TaxID=31033 RepID=UPI0002990F7C|nr:recQ-mediated genome instability protein 1 [Takifugu rubripes]XP_029685171.1 recQ-mediated genome instability protein 1 [Takifugu rubripes]|eukprot:XP_003974877.1 PREDICTED: recQ-mediated genome instability protein 1 [Takifugu rubripes]